jgi:ribosome-associated protein
LELAHTIVNTLEEKKAENILLLDIKELTAFTDYFIICTGTSNRMLNALADGVSEKTRLEHKKKGRIEGQADSGWIIVDYGDIVVHIFDSELRHYYKLEELWDEGKVLLTVQ